VSIFVDEKTKVVIQGLSPTGQGLYHGLRNKNYGTQVVAGTNPKRGGETIETGTIERPVTHWRTQMRYIVSNAGPAPVTVDLHQAGLSWDTRVIAESLPSEKPSDDEALWHVPVPANGETVVTATFETRY